MIMKKFDDFELNLETLDKLVASLESGELSLSDALSTFEKGVSLINQCQKALDEAEAHVKVLVDDLNSGEKVPVDFEEYGE